MGKPVCDCDRETFFKWLNDFPATWEITHDDVGNTTVTFHYQEDDEEGEDE